MEVHCSQENNLLLIHQTNPKNRALHPPPSRLEPAHWLCSEEQYIQMNNIHKKWTKKTVRKLYNKDCSNYPLLLF